MTKAEQIKLRKEWEARVTAFKASGQTRTVWCAAHDLKPHQLGYWLRKLEPKEPVVTPSPHWMSLEVSEQPDEAGSSLLVKIGQTSIEVKPGFNPTLFSQVVRTLKTLC